METEFLCSPCILKSHENAICTQWWRKFHQSNLRKRCAIRTADECWKRWKLSGSHTKGVGALQEYISVGCCGMLLAAGTVQNIIFPERLVAPRSQKMPNHANNVENAQPQKRPGPQDDASGKFPAFTCHPGNNQPVWNGNHNLQLTSVVMRLCIFSVPSQKRPVKQNLVPSQKLKTAEFFEKTVISVSRPHTQVIAGLQR